MNDWEGQPYGPSSPQQWFSLQWRSASSFFHARIQKIFFFCLAGMAAVTVVTILFLNSNPQVLQELWNQVSAMFEQKEIVEGGEISLISLFFNNVEAGAYSIGLGIIPFLFLPIYSLLVNSMVVGVMGSMMFVSGLGIVPFLAGILPHGIFEIPALVLGISLGIRLCITTIKLIFRKTYPGEFFLNLKGTVRIFFFWMVPLFAVAAVIETYITPLLLALSVSL